MIEFFKYRLESPPHEWRRIMKTLNAIEYIFKNGNPRFVMDFRSEMFKLNNLQTFNYYEDNINRGNASKDFY